MSRRSRYLIQGGTIGLALVATAIVHAGSVSSGGITLHYPEHPLTGAPLLSCEPWAEPTANTVTLTGVPVGSTVTLQFTWANPYTGAPNYLPPVVLSNVNQDPLIVPVSYPPDSTAWPVWDTNTNERAIAVSVAARVTKPDGTVVKLPGKQWWIRCVPPPPPAQGCTPGYWRQDQHFDSWLPTLYAPTDDFEIVFGVDASFDPHSLLDAIWLGGGGERALARHAVAALLNASHPDVSYALTIGEVIAGVQNAYATGTFEPFKNQLDFANNAGCSLD